MGRQQFSASASTISPALDSQNAQSLPTCHSTCQHEILWLSLQFSGGIAIYSNAGGTILVSYGLPGTGDSLGLERGSWTRRGELKFRRKDVDCENNM